ncbi:MAG: response regulator [Pseudonocardiaceae bacterium]
MLIVDEDARVRTGLAALLTDTDGLMVAGACGDMSQAVRLAARLVPDVVLLDLLLPEHEVGLTLLRHLCGRGLAVVVLSARGGLRVQALHAGAAAFLEKGCQPDAIVAALRSSAIMSRPPSRL